MQSTCLATQVLQEVDGEIRMHYLIRAECDRFKPVVTEEVPVVDERFLAPLYPCKSKPTDTPHVRRGVVLFCVTPDIV